MFTRLDSERNAKVMKRAVNEQKLEYDKYKKAVSTMDTYVSLPAQRFAYLVRKYVHHRRMRVVEDNVRLRRADLDDEVYMTLGKMESLQNERARKWEEKMDRLGDQRQQLANMLMQTLDSIEEESGIFLIKPMFAYKSLYNPKKFYGKPYEQYWSTRGEVEAPAPAPAHATHGQRGYSEGLRKDGAALDTLQSTYMPPTPASGKQEAGLSQAEDDSHTRRLLMGNPQDGIAGKGTHLIGSYPQPSWNPGLSQPKALTFDALTQSYLNTPKMLELDINRMLIAQNQISTRIASQGAPGEQVATAGMRSYITLKRHVGQPGVGERHTASGVTVKRPEMMAKSMSLPPIAPTLTKDAEVSKYLKC
ncbi:hypothetical protein NP493_1060g01039 [Ridgeia piscesae]|uniref:Uncharacterized protein n=1 Tax=Ridgeia piscesae TaxID=27915 RepID=A0AAD9KHZ7_RIDPI|nr:hypothetical protein NP493_1060g01039 [Ridgeia piscesae]